MPWAGSVDLGRGQAVAVGVAVVVQDAGRGVDRQGAVPGGVVGVGQRGWGAVRFISAPRPRCRVIDAADRAGDGVEPRDRARVAELGRTRGVGHREPRRWVDAGDGEVHPHAGYWTASEIDGRAGDAR